MFYNSCINVVNQEVESVVRDNGNIVGVVTAEPQVIGENTLQVGIDNSASGTNVRSPVLDITLRDSSGFEVQPLGNLQVCIQPSEAEQDDSVCLAFLDENNNRWRCEDPCLQKDNQGLLCGETSHLTKFSLLVDPTGKSGDCGSSDWNGITGAQWADYVVIGAVTAFVCVVAIMFVILSSFCPKIHGDEHARQQELRSLHKTMVSTR